MFIFKLAKSYFYCFIVFFRETSFGPCGHLWKNQNLFLVPGIKPSPSDRDAKGSTTEPHPAQPRDAYVVGWYVSTKKWGLNAIQVSSEIGERVTGNFVLKWLNYYLWKYVCLLP